MPPISWVRLIIGGLIAAVILFLSDGFFHERVVADDWTAVYRALGVTAPRHNAYALIYFGICELGRGFVAILLYVLMRSCCRPGPKTAAMAGLVVWIAFSVTDPASFIPLGFYSHALWIKIGAFHLVTSIVATIAGAAVYKDGKTAS